MENKLTQQQIDNFVTLSKKQTTQERWPDPEDWNPCDMSGGNYDDAYWLGYNDSEIENARIIVNLLNL